MGANPAKGVFALLLAACGGPAPPADAGAPSPLVVDVEQTWRAYFAPDAAEDEVEGRAGPPYDLPPGDAVRWGAAYFEHVSYACARSGQQSFLLLNPPGADWATPMDLFVYLHGGGIGAFDDGGDYAPDYLSQQDCRSMVDQEDPSRLLSRWSGAVCDAEWPPSAGIARAIVEDADMRILIVSKCDQDTYAGEGTADPNNGWSADNRVDGLWATVAAVELAHEVGATNDERATILAGASAGGVGVLHLWRALEARGHPVAGVVSDGAVMTDAFDDVYAEAPDGCPFRDQVADPARWRPRLGRLARSEEQPHLHLRPDSPPVYLSWSPEDATFCSPEATERVFRAMHDAVLEVNPGGVSEAHRSCVDGDCDAHALIRWASADAEDSERCDASGCASVIGAMHDWIRARRE